MTETPQVGARRINPDTKEGKYFRVEMWMTCNCPVCEEDGHWIPVMGTPFEDEAKAAVSVAARMNTT